jgi:hypothetical protein
MEGQQMSMLSNELQALIDQYRITEAPTDALNLADWLVTQTKAPYLVEDRKDGMIYAWETLEEARQYANTCIEAQGQAASEARIGVNHKTRKVIVLDEQNYWQGAVDTRTLKDSK